MSCNRQRRGRRSSSSPTAPVRDRMRSSSRCSATAQCSQNQRKKSTMFPTGNIGRITRKFPRIDLLFLLSFSSMQTDVFLIGAGQTRFGEWWDKSLKDLMSEATDAAMETAPCSALDVDFVIVANMLGESVSGQAHLGAIASALLPHRPPALRVEAACASGSVAIHTALSLLESGRAENVLVIGVEKMTDVSTSEIAAALMG